MVCFICGRSYIEREIDDVFDSLTALGYSVQEAREAISSINLPDLTTEEKIRMALEHIANR